MDIVVDPPTEASVGAVVARIAAQHDLAVDIGPTDALVDRGMTSMAMVDLMLAIEAAFDVTIPQRDLTTTNFESVQSLTKLLQRLR